MMLYREALSTSRSEARIDVSYREGEGVGEGVLELSYAPCACFRTVRPIKPAGKSLVGE